jgi:hypothetical protein
MHLKRAGLGVAFYRRGRNGEVGMMSFAELQDAMLDSPSTSLLTKPKRSTHDEDRRPHFGTWSPRQS